MDTADMKHALHSREGRAELRSYLWTAKGPDAGISARMALIEALDMLDGAVLIAPPVAPLKHQCALEGCTLANRGSASKYCSDAHRKTAARRAYNRRRREAERAARLDAVA